MDDLTADQVASQKQALLELKAEVETVLRQSQEDAKPVELDQPAVGRLSRMDAIQQQKMAEANRRRQQIRLARIKAALQAIDEDEYGICRRCEEPIAIARLRVQPECVVCLACQASLETRA